MCDLQNGFKLCACDEKKLEQKDIGWGLQRVAPNRTITYRKGRAAVQKFNIKEEDLRNKIMQELNAQNCFDFEFEPQENDRLQIRYKENNWFAYRYQKGQWQKDNSTSLDGWRSLLENHKNGVLC